MIPAAILHPFFGPHPALIFAPVVPIRTPAPAMVEQQATEASSRCASVATTEHARLSANTAELWFALVARLDP